MSTIDLATPHTSHRPKVYVAGATGMVGTALCRRLQRSGYPLVLPETRVDLRDQQATEQLIRRLAPDWIMIAAAKVGGIYANKTYPAEFIYDNLMIQTNIMHAAYQVGVSKLLFLGSSCIYPRLAPQPMSEDYLLSGYLEPTNMPYAIAKIAGIVMAQAYRAQYGMNCISVMPANLFGPNDHFHPLHSHVVAALMLKMHQAKEQGRPFVEAWGTGEPRREFLHVDDMADACVFLMEHYDSSEIVNIGRGEDISVRELAEMIKDIVEFKGKIRFDPSMPDGTPRKLLDITKLTALGWRPSIPLREGLEQTYHWFLAHRDRFP